MELIKHEPGEKVIQQNDQVLDGDGVMNEASKMFFIISGCYKVHTGMFAIGNKYDDFNQQKKDDGIVKKRKILEAGDHFGEVSLIFGCRRTSTVKA